jgi:hypothetical protein
MISPKPPQMPTLHRRERKSRMTICAAMRCVDGIVLCADTLETVGNAQRYVDKLVELPLVSDDLKAIVVCATEDALFSDALIDKISEAIDRSNGTFSSAKDAIEDVTQQYCRDIWGTYSTTQEKPIAEMLIGLKTSDDIRLLHIRTPIVHTIETPEFIGAGRDVGIYKANQFGLKDIPVDTAAPIIAYIVDIVKSNAQYCGGPTNLAILHSNGHVEHKSQDYITKTTQGYKSIEWLLNTWVFPFLPLMVGEVGGEDALSLIGKLGEPTKKHIDRIPEFLKFLSDRKKLVLAGEIPAIPQVDKDVQAVNGFSYGARVIVNAAKQLHDLNLIKRKTRRTIEARYTKVQQLTELVKDGMKNPLVGRKLVRESLDRLTLLLTSFESIEQLRFGTSEDQPPPYVEGSLKKESSNSDD